jgi:DNA repair protein RadA/Sms
VAERSIRLGVKGKNFYIYHETVFQNIEQELRELKPSFLVVDSIQTMASLSIPSAAGTVSQVREVTFQLLNYAKASQTTIFVIGHITKDGTIAGPKILEHMVDTVIYFEGDQLGHYRLLRSIKNRFGSTNEVGIFEMSDKGLIEVKNPSQYFLDECLEGSFGRSITCILEGSRALFIEIQALVVDNKMGLGRRTTQGVDNNRLSMIVAVMEKYFGLHLTMSDIYLNVVGGIKLKSRDSDLSILASLISSYRNKPIDPSIVFLGEIGLTGEVRSIPQIEVRLKEIQQLNYKTVITSYKLAKKHFRDFDKLKMVGIKRAIDLESFI